MNGKELLNCRDWTEASWTDAWLRLIIGWVLLECGHHPASVSWWVEDDGPARSQVSCCHGDPPSELKLRPQAWQGGRDALVKLVIADYMFLLQGQTSDGQPVSGRTQSWKWCLHLSKSLWISRTRKLKLTVTENCFAAASTNKFCFPLITSHAVMSRAGPMLDFWGRC